MLCGVMTVSTYLVRKGISRSATRFPLRQPCPFVARLFSFLMIALLFCQASLLFMFFFPSLFVIIIAAIFFFFDPF